MFITWFVESPFCSYTFNEATKGCKWYSSSFFISAKVVWQYKGNDGRFSTGNFFFRLISVTSKAKEGQVAILVYSRRCALVHGSVNKSCENRHPDSSGDTLIPLTNSSILEKEKKNPTLASWKNSMKIHRRFLSWGKLVDSVITQAQKRLKDSQKQKRQERKR